MDEPVTFTPTEWDIILHRLGAPDAIADVLSEELVTATHEEIWTRASDIGEGSDIDWSSPLDRAIIEDCCSGCTMFWDIQDAVACNELTKGQMLAMFKAAKSLSTKLKVEIPR